MPAKVYNFDHYAGYPMDPRVLDAMQPYFASDYGNPSSLHALGREPKRVLAAADERVRALINAEGNRSIIFTSGATEANNLALKGFAWRHRDEGRTIITSAVEHISVRKPLAALEKEGFTIVRLPVDEYGRVDPEALEAAISEDTTLISVIYANNEVGTIQPIAAIGEIADRYDIVFHSDAAAAIGKIPIDVEAESVDLLTLSSNDIYGPKGVGALYVRPGVRLEPILHGGGQQGGLRSGTENVPGIAGFGEAARIAKSELDDERKRLSALRDRLIRGLIDEIPAATLNGHPTERLPNNVNIRFAYIEGEGMVLNLDMVGIAVATGSACTSKTLEASHVLMAMGVKHEEAHGSLQMTLGKSTTDEAVDYLIEQLPPIVRRLRLMSPIAPNDLYDERI